MGEPHSRMVDGVPTSIEPAKPLYEGTKQLYAWPMKRGEYNRYRGWETPADEDPEDPGYLVEYADGGKPNHEQHSGYISWSPSDVFERTYRRIR